MTLLKKLATFLLLSLIVSGPSSMVSVFGEGLDPEPVEPPPVVLAVNETNGFQSATNFIQNYESRGSTRYNSTSLFVHLSDGGGSTAGSFFTKNRVFLPSANDETVGFSTYFEMDLKPSSGYADGFTYIISKDINVLGQLGGSIGYGGINNSIAVIFDNYNNGGQPPLCLSLGVNGRQQGCVNWGGPSFGNFRIWIDYSRNTNGGRLEVRMNAANNNRPVNPTRAWDNVSIDQIGNQFYTGFTAATGGETQVAILKTWYFSAAYVTTGINPKEAEDFVTDNVPPARPVVEPYLEDGEWFFKPDKNFVSEDGLSYIFTQGNNNNYLFYNPATAKATFQTSDQLLQLFALDQAGNLSPAGQYQYFRADYILNYQGAPSVIKHYPALNNNYPVTEMVDLFKPIRPGYRFDGWARLPLQTTDFIDRHSFVSNVTFFARWSFQPYTVNFDSNGGSAIESIQTDINQGFELPPTPEKPNHQFDGWFLDPELTIPFDLSTFPHTSLTLYAKWIVDAHVITLVNNSNDTTITQTLDYGSVLDVSSFEIIEREGFVHGGFYLDSDYQTPFSTNLTISGDQTIYEKWIDIRPVLALHEMIETIPQPLTTQLNPLLIAAREAYDNLTSEQKAYVDPTLLSLLEDYEVKMVDLLEVERVVNLIDQLPRIISLNDQELIGEALDAFTNLSSNQADLFPMDRAHHLNDLTSQYRNLSEASQVEVLILEIPQPFSVNDVDEIRAAVEAFDALQPEEKAMMNPQLLLRLELAKKQLPTLLDCLGFIELFQAIGTVSLLSESSILEAFAYYANMSTEARSILNPTYYQELVNLSKHYIDLTFASPVQLMIDQLANEITLDDETSVLNAYEAYMSLSRDQQALIDDSDRLKLLQAVAQIQALNNPQIPLEPTVPSEPNEPTEPINPVPPETPRPTEPTQGYFPWIVIVVLVTWLGGFGLMQKQSQ